MNQKLKYILSISLTILFFNNCSENSLNDQNYIVKNEKNSKLKEQVTKTFNISNNNSKYEFDNSNNLVSILNYTILDYDSSEIINTAIYFNRGIIDLERSFFYTFDKNYDTIEIDKTPKMTLYYEYLRSDSIEVINLTTKDTSYLKGNKVEISTDFLLNGKNELKLILKPIRIYEDSIVFKGHMKVNKEIIVN